MRYEMTYAEMLDDARDGEPIEGIVFGEASGPFEKSPPPLGKLITIEEAQPWLNIQFDAAFGGFGCGPMTAWTKSYVITVGTHDGSVFITRVPRHPVAYVVEWPSYSVPD